MHALSVLPLFLVAVSAVDSCKGNAYRCERSGSSSDTNDILTEVVCQKETNATLCTCDQDKKLQYCQYKGGDDSSFQKKCQSYNSKPTNIPDHAIDL